MSQSPTLPIAAVERETGISKETLRIWERRYGFPVPMRSPSGKRAYSADDVARLKLIAALIKRGKRPSKLMPLSLPALQSELSQLVPLPPTGDAFDLIIAWLKKSDADAVKNWLVTQIAKEGLKPFLEHTLGPILLHVGHAWKEGTIRIHEEHLFSQVLQNTLRLIISHLPVLHPKPHILLTTPEGELHGLGLLIVESALALEGIKVTSLGVNTPSAEIAHAAQQLHADVVILSISSFYQESVTRLAVVENVRALLPANIELWIGGQGGLSLPMIGGVNKIESISDLCTAVSIKHNLTRK